MFPQLPKSSSIIPIIFTLQTIHHLYPRGEIEEAIVSLKTIHVFLTLFEYLQSKMTYYLLKKIIK